GAAAGLAVTAVARGRAVPRRDARHRRPAVARAARRLPGGVGGGRLRARPDHPDPQVGGVMITHLVRTRLLGDALVGNTLAGHWRGGVGLLIRNANYHGANVAILVSGFVEPLLYLLSLGVGMGQLVDQVTYRGI